MASLQTAEIAPPMVAADPRQAAQNWEWLRPMSLFDGVSDEAVRALAGVATQVDTGGPELIFSDGDPGDRVFFVCSGEVEISLTNAAKTEILLETETDGDFFGEVGALQGHGRTATARARRKTLALTVPGETLKAVLREHPDILLAMYARTAGRLGRTSIDLRRTTSVDAVKLFENELSKTEKNIGDIAQFCGSLKMLGVNALFVAVWASVVHLLGKNPLDGVPFNLLALVLTLEAIAITCIVLHSQNLQEKRERFIKREETRANIHTEAAVNNLDEKLNALRSELLLRLPEPTKPVPALPPTNHREMTP